MRFTQTPWLCLIIFCTSWKITKIQSAIAPPPWGDPLKNPCAKLPGGWQLLFWPPLKQCFKIFQVGFPCPETMELSSSGGGMAECRCPPGTAQYAKTAECFKLFERGPCDIGEYFAPLVEQLTRAQKKSMISRQRWGTCKTNERCPSGMIFWPRNAKCYSLHTRGPCPKGKLLVYNDNGTTECQCDQVGEIGKYYYINDDTCHEHFTRGPCQGAGELFLPNGKCGCNSLLPHYHAETNQCYEIDSIGPCPMGHVFIIADTNETTMAMASCKCKDGYALWDDGYCYRLYTKGPCNDGEFIVNSTTCIKNPCRKGQLYFPGEQTCYIIGSRGPCSLYKVVVFDFTTRPSIDGISYNGVCGCAGIIANLDMSCNEDDAFDNACQSSPGMVEVNGQCHKLYTRGPCGPGEWLEMRKSPEKIKTAKCVCRPGHTTYETENGIMGCHAPSVGIARYLNSQYNKPYSNNFTSNSFSNLTTHA